MNYLVSNNISTISVQCELIEFTYNNESIKIAAHVNDYITEVISGRFVTTGGIKNFYEWDVLEYIKKRFNGGCALDIGSNIGNHSTYFSKFIFDKTFAFEPNIKNYILLLENKRLNNIDDEKLILNNVAISDGNYPFNCIEIPGNMGGNKVSEGVGNTITKRIDDFDLPKIDFIKIDVEGHELKVLRGANNIIKRDKPEIILECNPNTTSDFKIINPYMVNLGYELIKDFGFLKHYVYINNQ